MAKIVVSSYNPFRGPCRHQPGGDACDTPTCAALTIPDDRDGVVQSALTGGWETVCASVPDSGGQVLPEPMACQVCSGPIAVRSSFALLGGGHFSR